MHQQYYTLKKIRTTLNAFHNVYMIIFRIRFLNCDFSLYNF